MGTQFFLRWPIQYILCPFSWETCCHSQWTMPLGKSIFGKEALKWTKEPLNCIKSLHRTEPQIWRQGGEEGIHGSDITVSSFCCPGMRFKYKVKTLLVCACRCLHVSSVEALMAVIAVNESIEWFSSPKSRHIYWSISPRLIFRHSWILFAFSSSKWFRRNREKSALFIYEIRQKKFLRRKRKPDIRLIKFLEEKMPPEKLFLANSPSQAMRIKICVYPQNSFIHAIWLLFNKPFPSKKQ